MSRAKYIPEEILLSIQKLPQDSLGELVNFIEYLQYKNSLTPKRDHQNIQEEKITSEESEQIIEEILTEVGEDIPSLSDLAVSRAGIYEEL
jgi:hypothetical protein